MTAGRPLLYALALAGTLAFAALGTWQLGRAHEKERAQAAHDAAERMPPRELADALRRGASGALELPVRVQANGRYDDGVTLLLDNQIVDGKAGVDVLTVFHPEDSSYAVLVDRGWLPLPPDRRPPIVPATGALRSRIDGMLRAPPAQGVRMGNAEFVRGNTPPLLAYLDLDALERQSGTRLLRAVLLLAPEASHGFTRRWQAQTNPMTPERHRGYAVTWFALASLVVVTTVVLAWRR
jgi:cytochrome oxidase assembly protein ShyY1